MARYFVLVCAFAGFLIFNRYSVLLSSGRMMRSVRFLTLLLLAVLISTTLLAGPDTHDKKRIAVLDFRVPSGAVSGEEANYITELVRGATRKALPATQFIVMTKENLIDMLPPGKRLTDCVGECAVETGRKVGADYVVDGEVVRFGGELRVAFTLHDTREGNLLATERCGDTKVLGLESPVETAAQRLFIILSIPTPSPTPTQTPSTPSVTPEPVSTPRIPFIWPIKGQIIREFGKGSDGRNNEGIDIGAPVGEKIVAAADGTVIVSDDRLKGYGNMVVIRHSDILVTIYAHNRVNLVAKGDKVKQGQVIAEVGDSGRADTPLLHFEIRQRATPLDPLRNLPEQ